MEVAMANPFRILTGMALLVLSFGAFAQFIVTGNNFGRTGLND